jgi:hypothetical protein
MVDIVNQDTQVPDSWGKNKAVCINSIFSRARTGTLLLTLTPTSFNALRSQ